MSREVLNRLDQRHRKLLDVQAGAIESQRKWRLKEKDAEESLELMVAYSLDVSKLSLRSVAESLNCSRDKVEAMAERARERTERQLQGVSEANARPKCDGCQRFLPGEYVEQGLTTCFWCRRKAEGEQ